MIKLIIFDFSKVCFNDEEAPYVTEFAKKNNLPLEEFEKYYYSLAEKSEGGEILGVDVWKLIAKKYNLDISPKEIIKEMSGKKEAYWDVIKFASELRKNYKVSYYTNYPKDYWAEVALRFDLKPYFDYGIVSYEVKARKPQTSGFKLLLKHYDITPEEAIFIDDKEANVKAAESIGIKGLHLTDRSKLKELLKEKGVDF